MDEEHATKRATPRWSHGAAPVIRLWLSLSTTLAFYPLQIANFQRNAISHALTASSLVSANVTSRVTQSCLQSNKDRTYHLRCIQMFAMSRISKVILERRCTITEVLVFTYNNVHSALRDLPTIFCLTWHLTTIRSTNAKLNHGPCRTILQSRFVSSLV
jgi:hypothetical protein